MVKKNKRFSKLKTTAVIAAAVATIGGFLGVSFGGSKPINVPGYRAIRVIDGDTFETEEHQLIRLFGSNAPELGFCGSEQAKIELGKLVMGKDIYLKVVFRDTGRSMAEVFTRDGSVDEKMLASGWAEVKNLEGFGKDQLKAANQKARAEKRGIYSQLCTQETNLEKPSCIIKGNIGDSGDKIYHFLGCNNYDRTVLEFHHGDQWFCTEADAQKAGFTKAERCPERYIPEKN